MDEKCCLGTGSNFLLFSPANSATFFCNDTEFLRFIETKKKKMPILFCHERFLFNVIFLLIHSFGKKNRTGLNIMYNHIANLQFVL